MTNHVSKYLAVINEDNCIGCTLCIAACPFDAILGAAKHLHSVIESYCTGCKLCVPPCPVDCIDIVENTSYKKIPKPNFSAHVACVDCGRCAPVCSSKLQPDFLYTQIKTNKLSKAQDARLEACTLCGDCDVVCPSKIPLTKTFQFGIQSIDLKKQKKQFAQDVKQRTALRENRIANTQRFKLDVLADQKNNIDDLLAQLKTSE